MNSAARVRTGVTTVAAVAVLMGMTVVLPIATRSLASSPPWDPFFATQTTAADLGATKAYGVAAGDYNGDGNVDMVVGRNTASTTGLGFAAPVTIKDYASVTGRPFGVAAADFDHDGTADLIVARTTTSGTVDFFKGNGDGTYAAAVPFQPTSSTGWRLEGANAFGISAGDVNHDGWPDLIFGAVVSGADTGGVTRVADGDIRALLNAKTGVVSSMFDLSGSYSYVRSTIPFAAGVLMGRIATSGTDVASVASADIDGNGYDDVVAGGIDGTSSVVRVILSFSGLTFASPPDQPLINESAANVAAQAPVYFPPQSTVSSTSGPGSAWGLAFADMNGDARVDLLVGDRGMYVYQFIGDGAGGFTFQAPSSPPELARPNALISLVPPPRCVTR